ncbi:hypothetical protein HC028_21590 [Planosporangium flavigriseum]|uniref:Excreted virulence factor EspC, type VII ESX diderm n=1 Tax=Planosporangium flavigriseum TaxID=373681 RepID=A0A8J3LQ77_9ACTN|nr:hypothetical protein [Planosporangium flavigriseum]NJC67074.1 hypothetical protein [Planosporangium flavigriseum]GIG75479.1 hypothetical protein Pfl04_38830 [Planosporangium flavigriseum]
MTQPSFRVDPDVLQHVAGAAGSAAHFCHRAHRAMGDELQYASEQSFGEYGVFGAFRDFMQRWRAEVKVTEEAAYQFSAAITESLDGYGHSDGHAVQRFGGR